jgi:hypothetical protein
MALRCREHTEQPRFIKGATGESKSPIDFRNAVPRWTPIGFGTLLPTGRVMDEIGVRRNYLSKELSTEPISLT